MKIDDNPRMTHEEYLMVQSLYMRRRPLKPATKPAIPAPSDTKGARLDVKG